ncbi:MAG: Gfo/Idh/MocA family oxidoreductase [Planctomycetes bacterium]|nr:Gfo/Idh/MocA family oxidoreductase [Planctomycetota bacterium]
MNEQIGVGVIGLGFMGARHIRAYAAAGRENPCRIVAVCDRDEDRLTGTASGSGNIGSGAEDRLFDPAELATYTDVEAMLADDSVELVSVCTHTDTHVDTAIAALRAGKHVLVEKPVAIEPDDISRLAVAADESGRLCMPAMCMRFWPAWAWLKDRIDDESFGRVQSAVFRRLGSMPTWARDFYADESRSGGALVDLHIHDTDFVTHCFGMPRSVSSAGSVNHVTTAYRFSDAGPRHVVAEGAWGHSPSFGFHMSFIVSFERATVAFDLAREQQLVLYGHERPEPIDVDSSSGYDGEIRALLQAVREKAPVPPATLREAIDVARVLGAERASLLTGETVTL